MLLRTRVALGAAAVVALVIAAMGVVTYLVTQHNLRDQLDDSMIRGVPPIPPAGQESTLLEPNFDALCEFHATDARPLQQYLEGVQLLRPNGTSCAPVGVAEVVTGPADHAVSTVTWRDGVTRAGTPVRVLLSPLDHGEVLVTNRSLLPVEETLRSLRDALLLVTVLGTVLAGAAALLLTRITLRPLTRLAGTAEHIARTDDLTTPVEVTAPDEAGRVARAFAGMVDALAESRRRQRDLVADAAHELRTPLTSLRTNIDLLVRSDTAGRPLPEQHRARIMTSLQDQTGEFATLVTELLTLATGDADRPLAEVDIEAVIDRAVRRAGTRAPRHHIETDTVPWIVTGNAPALERTVLNLLDNATKFSPPGSVITIGSRPGWITVQDQGPGIPTEHRDQVFQRFWRTPEARPLPGSGLGLAIAAATITAHHGTITFQDSPHGALARIELPS
jgi:two-component system sensor histidine kinase MprB